MENKRGQLSVETMIIYGLVILIALGVIAGLIYFKVLNIDSYLPEKCDLGGTGDLKCEEWRYTTDGQLELGIRNLGQKPIDMLSVRVEDNDDLHFTTQPSGTGARADGTVISSSASLAPGDIAKVSVDTQVTPRQGKTLRGTLYTSYKFKDGVVVQESVGSLRLKVG
jgi:hypothetical protein